MKELFKSYTLSKRALSGQDANPPKSLTDIQVRKIVEKHLRSGLLRKLGIDNWDISYTYTDCDEVYYAAQCGLDPAYKHAHITINPTSHENEEDVNNSLIHELMHIVASPVESVHMIDIVGYQEDSAEYKRTQEQWRQAIEQLVCNLTKIYLPLLGVK